MSESVYAGLTSQTIDIFLADSSSTTGAGLSGLTYSSSGLKAYYRKGATGSSTAITLATQTVGGAWSSGGFVEIDATNMKGVYRFDLVNAMVDTEGFTTLYFYGATNLAPTALRIDCRPLPADVKKLLGTAWLTPGTAGTPDVNVKLINAVSASSVTTINANIGTTQPVNFTGAGASALAKSDMVDVAGAAVSTSTAQIGVNVVNFGGSAGTFSGGRPETNTTHWGGTAVASASVRADLISILGTALTETAGQIAAGFKKFFNVATPTGTVNSIPDAVAGATGGIAIVGSNMGSVTNVSGNVGGNVTGSVGSLATQAKTDVSTAVHLADSATYGLTTSTMGRMIRNGGAAAVDTTAAGTPSTTSIQLSSGSTTDDFYKDCTLYIDSGTGAGQAAPILSYTGATKTVTLDEALAVAPSAGDAIVIRVGHVHPKSQIAAAVWAAGTRTLTSFGTLVADVWSYATRILTAGTNISLAKGTGVTGFNDLSASDVRTAVGLASANLDTQIGDLPTNSELAAAIITGLTTALAEGYRATGSTGSVRDILYEILGHMINKGIVGTTLTTKKLDKTTTAKTYTLDNGTTPTAIEETT